jgi:hypothetical protein
MKYRTRIYYSAEQRAEIWDPSQRCKHRLPAVGGNVESRCVRLGGCLIANRHLFSL